MAIKKTSWIVGAFLVVLAVIWVAWSLYNAPGSNGNKSTAIELRNWSASDKPQSEAVTSLVSGFNIQSSKINNFDPALSKAVETINQISMLNKSSIQAPRPLDVVRGPVPLAQPSKVSASRPMSVPKVSRPAV